MPARAGVEVVQLSEATGAAAGRRAQPTMARYSTWLARAIGLAACLAGMTAASPVGAWELMEEYDPVEGYLGDKQPDTKRYRNWEIYDPPTGKFYSVFELAMEDERALTVDVYSFDFQPIIVIQDKAFALIAQGTINPTTYNEDGSKLYHARLELHTPWAGPAELLISSYARGSRGSFKMEWSLWGPDLPSQGTGGVTTIPPTSDCDCQDPATGRRYQSPFEDLGECRPERAIKWCN